MQDIQFHPVTDKILHIDFLEVFDDKVTVEIPVILQGMSPGVRNGGNLYLEERKLSREQYLETCKIQMRLIFQN